MHVVMPPWQTESYVSLVAGKVASVRNPRKKKKCIKNKLIEAYTVFLLSLLLPLLTITIIIISVGKKTANLTLKKIIMAIGVTMRPDSGIFLDLPDALGQLIHALAIWSCSINIHPRAKGVRLNMVKCGFMVLKVLKCCYM